MKRVLMLSTVASLQDQFNMANIRMLRNLHCDVHVACNFVQGNNTSPQRIAVFQNELAALGVTQSVSSAPKSSCLSATKSRSPCGYI